MTTTPFLIAGLALGVAALSAATGPSTETAKTDPALETPAAPTSGPALGSAAAQQDSPLQRALDTITAEEIRADLTFIASDAMKGRDSPSPQLEIAARYIRARLMRLGFEPGAPGGSYLYEWQINQLGFDEDSTGAVLTAADGTEVALDYASDYFYPSWQSLGTRDVSGPVVHGGDMSPETLEGIDVTGKWILDSGESKGLSGRRRRDLQERGAVGVIALPRAGAEQSVADIFGRQAARFRRSSLRFDVAEDRPGFPVLHLTEEATARVGAADLDGVDPGDTLDWTLSERCKFGNLGAITLENVVGLWPGSDPQLKDEVIILSAHYDHVGHRPDGTIYNGADDNGSGTTGMLAIAEALEAYGPMRRSVMLMWVSAEEKGLLGSEAWTKDPYLPDGMTALCNINIDMIGRNASDEFLITPTSEHKAYSALTKVAEAHAAEEGFKKIKSADAYWSRSDHANFERNMGLPVAFLFCDVHEDYHRETDTVEKIDFDKMRRICRLVVRMLEALQIDEPKF